MLGGKKNWLESQLVYQGVSSLFPAPHDNMDYCCQQDGLPASQRTFTFAEVVKGRDASVRVTEDGLLFAVDLTMVMSGLGRDQAGLAIRRLPDELFPSIKLIERRTPGKGNAYTKLVSFDDAIELVMVLPGKVARETRVKFADIIKRYLAGDLSLIKEIHDNAVSDSLITQMAQASMDNSSLNDKCRKRQLEREDVLFEMEMAERKQRLLNAAAETQAKTVSIQKTLREEYTSLCPGQLMDERARVMFKDNLLNLAFPQGIATAVQVIGNGDHTSALEDTRPLTISSFALEEGKRYDTKALQRIGSIMSSMYQKKYGGKASQHEQYTEGAVRAVRSYTWRDQDMLREAFSAYDAQYSTVKP